MIDFYFLAGTVGVYRDKKSPYWQAIWTTPQGGRQYKRTTKVPAKGGLFRGKAINAAQAKQLAMKVAIAFAGAEKQAEEARKVDNTTVRTVCEKMIAGKLGRVSHATYENARADYKQFLGWLGRRADEPIRLITRADMKDWIIDRRSQVRAKTVSKALGEIRAAFEWAVDAEIIARNPCDKLKIPPDSKDEKVVHEAFTLEEVRLLVEKLPDEWSAAVRLCLGTYGQRLGDLRALKWDQFDWNARTVNIVTGKTGQYLQQPMMHPFFLWAWERYTAAQAAGGEAAIYVLPTLRRHSNPSTEFTKLMQALGVGRKLAGSGGARRNHHSKTFHSLRATVATMLHASGVSQGLAMALVGHKSAAVHAVYIRPTAAQLADAASMLPYFNPPARKNETKHTKK